MPIVRRRDLIVALQDCWYRFLETAANLNVPERVRLANWRIANEVQVLLRDA